MTVKEVIETVDALRPNEIAAEDKRKWLYELESRIYEDLYVTHEHEGIEFYRYGKDHERRYNGAFHKGSAR